MAQTPQRNALLAAVAVLVVAASLRALLYYDLRDNPFFLAPVIDAEFYHDQARSLAERTATGRAPFMMPPLYPVVLSGVYRLRGIDLEAAHVLQFVFGTLAALVTFALGLRVGGLIVGLVAGLVVATSHALLFVEADLLATPLALLLDVSFLYAFVRFLQTDARRHLLASGALLGLAALARPTILALLPPLVLWLAWRGRRLRRLALWLVFVIVPIVPITWHNLRASGEFVPISANGGINFYIGNNPDMRRTVALRPGPEYRRMNDLPLSTAGQVTALERDRWFYREGLRFWQRQPLRAVQFTLEKLILLVHNHEQMRDVDYYFFRQHYSWLLQLPSWNFAILFGLAVAGMVWARRGSSAERFLLVFLLFYAAGIVLFFVSARYRAALIPGLGVFAGMGIDRCWHLARAERWRQFGPALLVALLATAVSWVDWYGVDGVDEVEARYRVASTYEKRGDFAAARRAYDEVLQLDPHHLMAAARAAGAAQQLGSTQEAVDRYELLLQRHPDYVEGMINLANLAWRFGDVPTAEHYFGLAITTESTYAQAHGFYAMFLLTQRAPERALAAFDRALALDPSWELLRIERAQALLQANRAAAALQELDDIVRFMPISDRIELMRGDAFAALGDPVAARSAWENGLKLNPASRELESRLRSQSIGSRSVSGSAQLD